MSIPRNLDDRRFIPELHDPYTYLLNFIVMWRDTHGSASAFQTEEEHQRFLRTVPEIDLTPEPEPPTEAVAKKKRGRPKKESLFTPEETVRMAQLTDEWNNINYVQLPELKERREQLIKRAAYLIEQKKDMERLAKGRQIMNE